MEEYADYSKVQATIANLFRKAIPCQGVFYRFVKPNYADPVNLLSGEGAFRTGGRWNWPGLCHALYGSRTHRGAVEEAASHAQRAGATLAEHLPRVLAAFRVELACVLDLTSTEAQAQLGLIPSALMDEPWEFLLDEGREAFTHAIGRAAFRMGVEGLLVPSAPFPTETNLVVFLENLRHDSTISYYP